MELKRLTAIEVGYLYNIILAAQQQSLEGEQAKIADFLRKELFHADDVIIIFNETKR